LEEDVTDVICNILTPLRITTGAICAPCVINQDGDWNEGQRRAKRGKVALCLAMYYAMKMHHLICHENVWESWNTVPPFLNLCIRR